MCLTMHPFNHWMGLRLQGTAHFNRKPLHLMGKTQAFRLRLSLQPPGAQEVARRHGGAGD